MSVLLTLESAFFIQKLLSAILRNVINSKVEGTSDPIEISRHWLKLERMEKKQKKAAVDTKAEFEKILFQSVAPIFSTIYSFFVPSDCHQQLDLILKFRFQVPYTRNLRSHTKKYTYRGNS